MYIHKGMGNGLGRTHTSNCAVFPVSIASQTEGDGQRGDLELSYFHFLLYRYFCIAFFFLH